MLHQKGSVIYLTLYQIIKNMKKKIVYAVCLILMVCSLTACEFLGGNCQICQTVSYENGNPFAWGLEKEYCGEDLLAVKRTPPYTSGGVTTQWECY